MNETDARHEAIERDAADWLAALDTERADIVAFEAWRASDPEHAIAFIRVESAWRKLDNIAPASVPVAESEIVKLEASQRRVLSRRQALAGAGVAAVAAAGSTLFVANRAAAHVVETAIGERRRFYVAHGVCVDLNTGSRLRWWMTGNAVKIELQRGELSLDLSPGAPRCTLSLGAARVWVEQGHCIARLRGHDVADVVALAGEIHLLPRRGKPTAIIPERAKLTVLSDTETTQPLTDTEVRAAMAWQEGELLLDGEPLSVAVAEYNRYLPKPLALDTVELGKVRLGGRFLANDPTEFLAALRTNFAIRSRVENGRIVLSR